MTDVTTYTVESLEFGRTIPCESVECESDHPPAAWYWRIHCGVRAACADCDARWRRHRQECIREGLTAECLICAAVPVPIGSIHRLGPVPS